MSRLNTSILYNKVGKEAEIASPMTTPLNEYVKIMVEYGLIGLLLFLAIPIIVLTNYRQNVNSKNKFFLLAVISGIFLILITSCFANSLSLFSFPVIFYFYFFLGMYSGICKKWKLEMTYNKRVMQYLKIGALSFMIIVFSFYYIFNIKYTKAHILWAKANSMVSIFGNYDDALIKFQ